MTPQDILDVIKLRASHRDGVTIQKTRNTSGGPYWSIRDSEINAGGYETMEKAFEGWIKVIKYLQEKEF